MRYDKSKIQIKLIDYEHKDPRGVSGNATTPKELSIKNSICPQTGRLYQAEELQQDSIKDFRNP
jgi:hypothetical protein